MSRVLRWVRDPSKRGLAAQLFSLGTILVIQLLQVPIFIAVLGVQGYGSYLVLIAIPSALTLADFGLLSATSTRLMTLLSHDRIDEAKRLSRFTNSVVVYLTGAALVVVGCAVMVFDVSQPGFGLGESRQIVMLYSFYAVLFVVSSSFEGSMRAAGAFAGAWTRLALMRLVDFAVAVVILVATGEAALAVSGMVVSRMICLVLLRVRVRRVAPWASWALVRPRAAMAPGMLRPTLGSLALPVGNALVNQGALLGVSAALGPAAVATFSTVRTLVNVLRQLAGTITNSELPVLTRLLAKGRRDVASAKLRRIVLSVLLVGVGGGLLLTLAGPFIVDLWTNGKVSVSNTLVGLLALQAVVETSWVALSLWFLAQNRHLGYSLVYLLSAASYVVALFVVRPGSLEVVVLIQIACSSVVLIWVAVALWREGRNG